MPFIPDKTLPFSEHWARIIIRYFNPRPKPMEIPTTKWDECPTRVLCVNEKWASHILGALDILDQWDTWKGTNEEIDAARQQINQIIDCFMGGDMNCCCGGLQPIGIHRVTDAGELQVSYDGGTTWQTDPADPRISLPILPPPTGGSTSEIRCKFAGSATELLRQQAETIGNDADAWAGVSTLIGALITLLIAIGIIGSGGLLTPVLLGLAAALLAGGRVAFVAAMTPAVYNNLQCIFYCSVGDDGVMTQSGLNIVRGKVNAEFTGIANSFIIGTLNTWGLNGVNQAGHAGLITDNDCSDCDCGCTSNFVVWSGLGGTVTRASDEIGDYMEFDAVFSADKAGGYGAGIVSVDKDACCNLIGFTGTGITGGTWRFNNCGSPLPVWPSIGFDNSTGIMPNTETPINCVLRTSVTPFTARFYLG